MADRRSWRVLAVVKGLGPGGAEQLLLTTAHTVARDGGHALDVAYVLAHKDHLVGRLREAGAGVHALGGPRGMRDLRWIARLRRLLASGRYDVVHLHSPLVGAVARLLARTVPAARRPAVVSTEHNSWSSHNTLTRWANRATFRLGDAWISVSDEVRSSMPTALRHRTRTIVHGIDLAGFLADDERAATRRELGAEPGTVVVLTIANLRRTKGYPDLLDAARIVADADPGVRFFAVGQGPMADELRERADELGLGPAFTFLGYREDAARLLAAADVFAMASHHEGYPIALMEALAAGRPVVATAVGGIPDAVTPGRNGVLVPPRDPAALAAALLELAADPSLRAELGAGARESAARFDFALALASIEAIYDRAASGR